MDFIAELADKAKYGLELERLKMDKRNLQQRFEKIQKQMLLFEESKRDKEDMLAELQYYRNQKMVYSVKIAELPPSKRVYLPVFEAIVKDFSNLIESLTKNLEQLRGLTGDMDENTFKLEKSYHEEEMCTVNESLRAVREIVHAGKD